MNKTRAILLLLTIIGSVGVVMLARRQGPETVGRTDTGAVVTTGQRIAPAGTWTVTRNERPKDLALAPDGQTVAVLCPRKVILMDSALSILGELNRGGGPLGIAWHPSGKRFYFSSGARVVEVSVEDQRLRVLRELDVVGGAPKPQGVPTDPQAAGLAVSSDGTRLYVALGTRNAVSVIDTITGLVVRTIPVGVCPYHLALSPNDRQLWVSNRGGFLPADEVDTALSAGTRVRIDRATDAALRGSVTLVDTGTFQTREISVGRQPSGIVVDPTGQHVYVANSDSDTISVLDSVNAVVAATVAVGAREDPGFGHMPTDIALSPDQRTLYVACGGANALAVLPLNTDGLPAVDRPAGYVPTGWFPIALAQQNGRVWIGSSKGIGSQGDTRNGARFVHSSAGVVQVLAPNDLTDLKRHTLAVASNNSWFVDLPARRKVAPQPIPERLGEPSVFEHVVYIIKENHTYDLTLGDMKEGNGDPSLCLFPEEVTPNQHAIAREFVLLDNTYTSGTNSADGHQWTSSAICNAYMEQNYSSYARSYPYDGGDPLAYSPKGFLWTAAAARGKTVRVFGEYVNRPKIVDLQQPKRKGLPTWTEMWLDYKAGNGRYRITAETDNAALRRFLHPHYIGFPMNASDQWRADQFLAEFRDWERKGSMPNLTIILLPNNHTSGSNPGMPTPRAMVADNDLAFGRIVDAISHSRFWPKTLILSIEDDSQLGVDHVDGHRTLAYCVSPYTRRGAVVSSYYDHTSITRTIGLVLGIPPMNRFDRTGRPLRACMQSTPDLRPFTHRPNKIPLDELNKPASALRGEARQLALRSSRLDWSDVDRAEAGTVARAVWVATRPGTRFPKQMFRPPSGAE